MSKTVLFALMLTLLLAPPATISLAQDTWFQWCLAVLRKTFEEPSATQSAAEQNPPPASGANERQESEPQATDSTGNTQTPAPAARTAQPPAPCATPNEAELALKQMLREKCGGCHIGQARVMDEFDFADFAGLQTQKLLVPGSLEESKIWNLVVNQRMPPSKWEPLNKSDLEQIRQNILDMAPPAAAVPPATAAELPTIIEAGEQDPRLQEFLTWARVNGLAADLLNEPGPFTILAPSSDAIRSLDEKNLEYLRAHSGDLRDTLLNHGCIGSAISLADMVRKQRVETFHSTLAVWTRSGETWIGSARVLQGDIRCSNGVIHIVDQALIPFDVSKKFPVPPVVYGPAGIQLVIAPEGRFQMGAPRTEEGYRENEGPRHVVQLDPFLIGKYEITRRQYKAVMNMDPSDIQMPGRRQFSNEDPAQRITWFDAVRFCNELSRVDACEPYYVLTPAGRNNGRQVYDVVIPNPMGSGYRLPTEAEWEYACRARGEDAYCFGDAVERLKEYGWYEENSGVERTRKIGQLKPNAFGLFDVHGNVAEWCQDWYFDKYATAPAVNPTGPISGTERVLRGGSYVYNALDLRCAAPEAGTVLLASRHWPASCPLPAGRTPPRTSAVC